MSLIGRPTEYSPALCEEIVAACLKGNWKATNQQIGDYCGVDRKTVHRWREKYPEFDAALRKAKVLCDNRVEGSLYDRASNGDTSASIYWLQNRRPEEWRNRRELDVRTPEGIQLEHSTPDIVEMLKMTPEQKAKVTRKHAEYLDEIRAVALLAEAPVDADSDE